MSVLKVYQYPHPVLREVCQPVVQMTPAIQTLVADMIETMLAFPGTVGLAACQVGHPVRLIVVDTSAGKDPVQRKVLMNPEIVQQSRNKMVREGCLSFPEYLGNIKRSLRVTVEGRDAAFEPVSYQVDGLEAVAIQHEIDHLNGVLLIDRVSSLKTDLIRRRGALPDSSGDES